MKLESATWSDYKHHNTVRTPCLYFSEFDNNLDI